MVRLGLRHCCTSLVDETYLKDSSSRRRTFSAALQEFEEQMKAAEVVPATTRPINLYYGLVQAGLAMTARARTSEADQPQIVRWRSVARARLATSRRDRSVSDSGRRFPQDQESVGVLKPFW
ncbi:YaaC family protein [Streptomyces sp. NPDC059168]|uniref:YaaC family protein n=1 Tax=Streptomyces sp. NPDC059168 TaxID=3346753 RepID=UPI0036851B41